MTLSEAIGQEISRAREQAGSSQQDLVTFTRALGLSWGQTAISKIERGARGLDAGELLFVPLVLGHLTGDRRTLSEVLAGLDVAEVEVVDGLGATPDQLGLWVNGVMTEDVETLIERRLADDLGVEVEVIDEAAQTLYGRRAADELSTRRLGKPGARHQVEHDLLLELRTAITMIEKGRA